MLAGLAQEIADAHRLVGPADVEGSLPDGDPAIAHRPNLDAEPLHRRAGVRVLPGAVPDIGERVAHQRPELLGQPVVLLAAAAGREEGAQNIAPAELRQGAEA